MTTKQIISMNTELNGWHLVLLTPNLLRKFINTRVYVSSIVSKYVFFVISYI